MGLAGAAVAVEPLLAARPASVGPWRMQAFMPGGLVPVGGLVAVAVEVGELVAYWNPDQDMTVGAVALWHDRAEVRRWSFLPVNLCGHDTLRVAARLASWVE